MGPESLSWGCQQLEGVEVKGAGGTKGIRQSLGIESRICKILITDEAILGAAPSLLVVAGCHCISAWRVTRLMCESSMPIYIPHDMPRCLPAFLFIFAIGMQCFQLTFILTTCSCKSMTAKCGIASSSWHLRLAGVLDRACLCCCRFGPRFDPGYGDMPGMQQGMYIRPTYNSEVSCYESLF